MHSSQCMLLCIKISRLYFWCQLSAWCLYMLASLLPSFPSLVFFYTTSDRKLGGHGSLGTRLYGYQLVYIKYEVICMDMSIHEHAWFPGLSLRTCTCIHRCMVNLALFQCSPYTKLTGMGLGMRLWLSLFSHVHERPGSA